MSKTKVKKSVVKKIQEPEIPKSIDNKKIIHQVIILTSIHLLYFFVEGFDYFGQQWISSVIYTFVTLGTIAFVWLQKKNFKYLIPIPFASVIVLGGLLEQTITTTVMFFVLCGVFFAMQYIEKKGVETIIVILLSVVALITLICFTLFDHGFVDIIYIKSTPINVIPVFWVIWNIAVLGLSIIHRKKFAMNYPILIIILFLNSVGPILGYFLKNLNYFLIFCAAFILSALILSFVFILLLDEFNFTKFYSYIGANFVSILIISSIFPINFTMLNKLNSSFLMDYVLLIPLIIITVVILSIKFYPASKREDEQTFTSFINNKELLNNDLTFVVTFIIFQASAILYMINNPGKPEFLLLKGLIISIIYVGATLPLNGRFSIIFSLISMLILFVTTLLYIGHINNKIALSILQALTIVILILMILNEKFWIGEPLTSNLSIVGTLGGLVTSILLFYANNVYLKEIWTSISWAVIGSISFSSGIIFNLIFLRRSGLLVLLLDIVYSTIGISINIANGILKSWSAGIPFIIIAIILITCIYLFKWSEHREKKKRIMNEEIHE